MQWPYAFEGCGCFCRLPTGYWLLATGYWLFLPFINLFITD
jgi:hypothetical protein